MKEFNDYLSETGITNYAQEQGYSDAEEALNMRGITFDFNPNEGSVPSEAAKLLGGLDNIVGLADWKARSAAAGFAYLSELDSYTRSEVKNIPLKSGEVIFRYTTPRAMRTEIAPLIKINVLRGLAYLLTEESSSGQTDVVRFEARGIKLKLLRLAPQYKQKLNVI